METNPILFVFTEKHAAFVESLMNKKDYRGVAEFVKNLGLKAKGIET